MEVRDNFIIAFVIAPLDKTPFRWLLSYTEEPRNILRFVNLRNN